MTIHSDEADPHWIGEHWLDKTSLQIDRMQAARSRIHPNQRIDVLYRDMDADWEDVMRRVYRFLDMDIGPALPAMQRYVRNAKSQHRWQRHRYDLTSFGLDQKTVRGRFERYASAFDLHPKPARPEIVPVMPQGARQALA